MIECMMLLLSLALTVDLGERGFINVTGDNQLFYWLYKSKHSATDPLIIWIEGGPGCSSEQAMFCEMGPFRLTENITIQDYDYSWTLVANLLFIDQPLGTGFSNTTDLNSIPTNENGVTQHLVQFFTGFNEKYPEMRNKPVIIMGHSYAGHFIPPFAEYVLKMQKYLLNIKAVAIGDGYMSPRAVYKSYREFAYKHNLIGYDVYSTSYILTFICDKMMQFNFLKLAYHTCNYLFDYILGTPARFNPLDIRPGSDMNTTLFNILMYDTPFIESLGLSNRNWGNCNGDVGERMKYDEYTDVSSSVDYIIAQRIPITFYYGNKDFLCNIDSFPLFIDSLSWGNKYALLSQPQIPWFVNGEYAGQYQKQDNVELVEIFDASHIAFYNKPELGFDMVLRIIKQISNQ